MIEIKKHSGIYTLTVMQQLPIGLSEAWEFFSSPKNLEKITPQQMGFKITSGEPGKMYPGQIISYKVSPLPGIKTSWVTEITQVKHGKFFVDEQRFGPYRMWHHEHHFEENEQGVMMTDKVSYKMPFGFLGHLAQVLLVKKQLKGIFEYRVKVLEEKFGK
ncbi:Ligand-binding SRPBCC domain-containing protein [Ekhidna lutea]|uniref:Ligand-binding SRPBCC domain-containing protein n=1 Tax=Ekhidna lutea TaxID=447679 RepID=A0A239EKN1_EKHLU|nr:SRPBCC family protein [Ekhidna lutea]SNS44434.1 Ligand-binding SRPBCC domain-containing protein [Ekhidna lutea]